LLRDCSKPVEAAAAAAAEAAVSATLRPGVGLLADIEWTFATDEIAAMRHKDIAVHREAFRPLRAAPSGGAK